MKRKHSDSAGSVAISTPADELMVWQALNIAHDKVLAADDSVFVIGEDVGFYGGSYRVTQGLYAKYGEWRVRDAPISEGSYTGLGVGAALVGARPIVEIMTVNFALLALDSIVNLVAKMRYMSGGQFTVPMVIRMPGGVAKQLAAQHSQRLEHTMMNVPGLRIAVPSTPQDSYWQFIQAVQADDPVIVLEHELLYFSKGPFDVDAAPPPLHWARVCREGTDITLIAWSRMVEVTLAAAEQLAGDGISAEVIDLRSLRPIDMDTLQASLAKTHRAIIVEEDCRFAGVGAEIAAELGDRGFFDLEMPVKRIAAADVPTPYNAALEVISIPRVDNVVQTVRDLLAR